jgi:hypothetical protein
MIMNEPALQKQFFKDEKDCKVLCVILSFNGCNDTIDCLKSLEHNRPDGFDIIVVDNASEKGVVEELRSYFPKVEIISLEENIGWAGGNNVGIRFGLERGYDWICLLNNDTVFPDGAARDWYQSLRRLNPCLAHPSIYYWDEPTVAQLHPGRDNNTYAFSPKGDKNGNYFMDYAYGACLAVHRSVIELIGLLDERFFLQLEETDYFFRSKTRGYESICCSNVKIYHKESRAFGGKRTPMKTYYSIRNALLLIEKKQENLKSKMQDYRALYWSISNIANHKSENSSRGLFFLFRWILSSTAYAKAVRAGIKDYLFRHFGKASPDTFKSLSTTSSKVTT